MTARAACLALAMVLSACVAPPPRPVGRDFSRAAFAAFVLQATTLPEVEALIGEPIRISTISGLANQHALVVTPGTPVALTLVNYFYAPFGAARLPSQTPNKSATIVFFQGKLVGYDVNSTIPGDDNAPVPEDRLADLRKGFTTRAEAIGELGPPDGQSIVFVGPAARRSSIMTYNWAQLEGDMVRRKRLRVEFDAAGRYAGYTMLDNSYPRGGSPIPFPAPPPQSGAPIAEPVRPYADPGHT